MASREWMITRVAITALSMVTLISVGVGASIVVQDMKRDVLENKEDIKRNGSSDEVWIHKFTSELKENNEEHVTMRDENHRLELMIGEFLSALSSVKDQNDDIVYEIRLNRQKIDALYNPDIKE